MVRQQLRWFLGRSRRQVCGEEGVLPRTAGACSWASPLVFLTSTSHVPGAMLTTLFG